MTKKIWEFLGEGGCVGVGGEVRVGGGLCMCVFACAVLSSSQDHINFTKFLTLFQP